jgi:predicted PurR-regulated permease PerM
MADTNGEIEVSPAQEPEEMPLPSDPKVIFLGGLFALALLAIAYVAAEIVLPFVFAITLKLLLQPILRILERLHLPRMLAALLLILALFGAIVGVGTAISGPAGTWAAKLPEGIPRLQERLSFLRAPIATLQHFLPQIENIGGTGVREDATAPAGGPTLLASLFAGTRSFASGMFTTVLFLYFLLVSGDIFLRRLVEILPHFSSKRQAVDISQQIESDISAYLVTITIMNAVVGIATGIVMWLTGVGDPILWGTLAFLLNYAPILGPTLGVVIFLLAGLLTIDTLWQALLPAGLYLAIHLVEGETLTPMLLARRFTSILFSSSCRSSSGLDVGHSGRHPLRALVGDNQDHLRPGSAARRAWPLPRGISNASGPTQSRLPPTREGSLLGRDLRAPPASRSGCRAAAGQPVTTGFDHCWAAAATTHVRAALGLHPQLI